MIRRQIFHFFRKDGKAAMRTAKRAKPNWVDMRAMSMRHAACPVVANANIFVGVGRALFPNIFRAIFKRGKKENNIFVWQPVNVWLLNKIRIHPGHHQQRHARACVMPTRQDRRVPLWFGDCHQRYFLTKLNPITDNQFWWIRFLVVWLRVINKGLEFYNDFFGIPYPLPKCDHVAVPDFSAGAMEVRSY